MADLRRIQMTRGGTFFITLQKDWASKNGIKRGSIVATEIAANGRLIIDPYYNLERTALTSIITPTSHLSREIIGKYLLGYDIIRIEAKDRISPQQREIVKQSSTRLIGLEIVEEDYAKIVMQCLLEPSALSPDKILRREHLITSGMYQDAFRALVEGDEELGRNVIARDNEADRLYFLVVRILRTIAQNPNLSEKLYADPIDCLDYRLTASLIESVGDQSSQIAEYAKNSNEIRTEDKILQLLTQLHTIVRESYEECISAFLSRNIQLAETIRDRKKQVEEMYKNIELKMKDASIEIAQGLMPVMPLISRIFDYSIDISDLTTPKI